MLAVKYYYEYSYDHFLGCHCHKFTTDKDCLSPEALFITSFVTEYPGQLWRMVERYAENRPNEWVSIWNSSLYREFFHGDKWES